MEVARRKRDPQLAASLLQQLTAGEGISWAQVLPLAMAQRHPSLTKALLAHRDELPEAQKRTLPLLLEYTFDARLGHNLAAWEAYLSNH